MPQQNNKKLIVITVEEILLVTASGGVKSEFEPSYIYGSGSASYPVFLRPQLRHFLDYCLSNFKVALWSELSPEFVQDALQRLYGDKYDDGMFEFIWGADECVPPSDDRYVVAGFVHRTQCKSFDKIIAAGYTEDEIVILDDDPKKWEPHGELPREAWVFATTIQKIFGNISIGGEPYSLKDTSLLHAIKDLKNVR